MRAKKVLTILLLGISAQVVAEETLTEGASLPALALKDQHERPAEIPPSTRQLLFAADNGGAGLVTNLLDSLEATWLSQTHRVYLADIHKMPGLISRLVALPRLQEKPYRIVLGREEADLVMFPRKKDCATVIPIQDGRLGKAAFACSDKELRDAVMP